MHRLKVSGMSCASCIKAVERAIWSADAGALVQVDLAKGEVSVETKANGPALVSAIRSIGFGVEGVTG